MDMLPCMLCRIILNESFRWKKVSPRKLISVNILTQPDDRREVGELGVADPLRYREAGNSNPGEEIVLEEAQAVFGQPLEDRDEVLDRFLRFLRRRLVPEFVKRIVGEQGLLEVGFQGGAEAPRGGVVHLVNAGFSGVCHG